MVTFTACWRAILVSTEPINGTKGKKGFSRLLANEVLNREHPGLHNQAMMEFGAMLMQT